MVAVSTIWCSGHLTLAVNDSANRRIVWCRGSASARSARRLCRHAQATNPLLRMAARLGDCPRVAIVARARLIESDLSDHYAANSGPKRQIRRERIWTAESDPEGVKYRDVFHHNDRRIWPIRRNHSEPTSGRAGVPPACGQDGRAPRKKQSGSE